MKIKNLYLAARNLYLAGIGIPGFISFMLFDFTMTRLKPWPPGFQNFVPAIARISGSLWSSLSCVRRSRMPIPALQKITALLSAIQITGWFILQHIPRAVSDTWIGVGESRAIAGGCLMICGIVKAKQSCVL